MRILLLGLNYGPELTGIGKYSGEMMEWLAGRGHEVRVVTTPPYYPAWKVWAGYRWWQYRQEVSPAGVRIWRCPLWVPEKPAGLSRVVHLGSFALSSLPVMVAQAAWNADVVITVEPAFFNAPVALLTAGLTGAASWLHIQDFEIDAAFDLGLLPREGVLHNFALAVERATMRRFRQLSSISLNMMKRIVAKGVDPNQTMLLPNWVDVDAVRPVHGRNRFRDELGIGDGKVVLLYSGNMGMKQNLEILPQLARELTDRSDVHFVFCGDGAFRPSLEEMSAGLKNVSLLPLQKEERLNELLNMADIHLLPQSESIADLVMPSKLTGMLASGRPVLATAAPGTQVADVIEGRGVAVPPGDLRGFRAAAEMLVENPDLRQHMGEAGRAFAEANLGRDQVLKQFEAAMLDLVGGRHSYSVT